MFSDIRCEQAMAATQQVMAMALTDGKAPVVLCIVDSAGSLLAFTRMDGAAPRLIPIAIGKAYTAARMRDTTLGFKQRLSRDSMSLADFCDAGLTSLPGGVPLMTDNQCWGAVGVSGRALLEDAALAEHYADIVRGIVPVC